MQKTIRNILALVVLVVVIFVFRNTLVTGYLQLRDRLFPCQNPIAYSVGTFDTRFKISRTDFLAAIKQAEDIWEKPIGKNLFEASDAGNLKINLLYDTRQKVTEKLKTLGLSVSEDKASYDLVEARYSTLKEQYLADRAALDAKVAVLKSHEDAYAKDVEYWNGRNGAPKAEYEALQARRQAILNEISEINQLQNTLHTEVDNINALVATLNAMARELNLSVDTFNEIGGSLGDEFEEGLYTTGPDGTSIDIYQYDNKAKLVRVLAHELGHALGLPHLENPTAIMYRLNQATNEKLTADDLAALKSHCRIN